MMRSASGCRIHVWIQHSDGSGTVDAVGDGVSREWIGRRVWCYAFGTAADYTVVSLKQVVELPESVSLEQGACLGIPGSLAEFAPSERIVVTTAAPGKRFRPIRQDELVYQILPNP